MSSTTVGILSQIKPKRAPFPDDDIDKVKPEKLTDPAHVAMDQLLAHALQASRTSFAEAGRDGVIVVISVSAESWIEEAYDQWKARARDGVRSYNGFHDHYLGTEADWIGFSATEHKREAAKTVAAENFSKAVAGGRHCAAFAADLSLLPSDIVHGADHLLALPLLTGADVTFVAREVCGGEVSEAFSDEQAALLTPRLLRLARRPGQTATAYLRKLRLLLDRDLASADQSTKASSDSIRVSPTLERLRGMEEAIEWGMNVEKDIRNFRDGKLSWDAVDRGLLLSGPPGCGKTLFARALAATCGVRLVNGSYGEWLGTGSAHQGDLLKALKKAFKQARDSAPSILFIDEVDSFPNRGTLTHHYADWEIQVVNALLSEIDGVEGREGVILLAACNFPEKLDPALVRSGRLDRHIRIQLPDRSALAAILREHLGTDLVGEDLSAAALAGAGSTGADCERFVRGARRRARTAGRELTLDDLMDEIRGNDGRSSADLQLAAVHEAGHALACCQLQPSTLDVVSLRASRDSGGVTMSVVSSALLSASDIQRRLILRLAGRAAEEVILGEPTSGAGGGATSDLAMATGLAASAAMSLGLDTETGLLWSGVPDAANLPRMLRDAPAIAARIRVVVDAAYAEALALIRRRTAAVNALAAALLEKLALDGDEAAAIVAQHPEDPNTEARS